MGSQPQIKGGNICLWQFPHNCCKRPGMRGNLLEGKVLTVISSFMRSGWPDRHSYLEGK